MLEQSNKYNSTHTVSSLDMATTTGTAPKFTGAPGENYIRWQTLFTLFIQSKELNPFAIKFYLLTLLDGEAKNFYEFIRGENLEIEEIFGKFKERFEKIKSRAELLEEIDAMRKEPRETWAGFIERFILTARKCEISETNQVEWIIKRIPEKLQLMLATLRLSLHDITMEGIRNVLNTCQTRGIGLEQIGTLEQSVEAFKTHRQIKKSWCDNHKWCHHTTEKCKNLKNKSTSKYSVHSNQKISLISAKNKILTTVIFTNGKSLQALVDTGADVSCVRKANAKGMQMSSIAPETVHSFNGETVIGHWTKPLTMKIFGETFNRGLLTFDRMAHDMIIGMDILGPLMNTVGPEIIFKSKQKIIKEREINQIEISEELGGKLTLQLKQEFKELFTQEIKSGNLCTIRKHCIDTADSKPVCRDGNRVPLQYEQAVEEEIESLKQRGIIRTSTSPWRFGIVVAPKPNGKIRMCIDYRPLNTITIKNAYPMPRIDEILDALGKAKIFSVIDATSGYHQIAMEEDDIEKTAFAWKGQLFEYTRMPFGLCNAPATFQATMDAILQEDKWKIAIPYLDDVIIYSESIEEHQTHLIKILNKIKGAGLVLNGEKCRFFKTEIEYLGHWISEGKIKPDPKKIQTIQECKAPITLKDLRSFLGLANFCGQFIPQYASKVAILTDLLKGEKQSSQKEINWTEKENESFIKIKDEIAKVTERSQPDLNKEFIITTDASNVALGAILTQMDNDGKERIISCFSKKFDKAQSNYSTTDKELIAVMIGIEHYRHYLLGKHFTLRTDHKALEHMKTTKLPVHAYIHKRRIKRGRLPKQTTG
jgi:predicted aspartyl protease